mmetsp:Transcript_7883/g.17632  ORF Transcript_7883/g.17632 Transcript_7883/m.17632 type:complete len:114 (+) Transcript_7883:324-665(+)
MIASCNSYQDQGRTLSRRGPAPTGKSLVDITRICIASYFCDEQKRPVHVAARRGQQDEGDRPFELASVMLQTTMTTTRSFNMSSCPRCFETSSSPTSPTFVTSPSQSLSEEFG